MNIEFMRLDLLWVVIFSLELTKLFRDLTYVSCTHAL